MLLVNAVGRFPLPRVRLYNDTQEISENDDKKHCSTSVQVVQGSGIASPIVGYHTPHRLTDLPQKISPAYMAAAQEAFHRKGGDLPSFPNDKSYYR